MKYRNFGKLDWKVSALGFGAMRLPIVNDDSSNINESEAIKMIRYAIDHGVNYIDTAYPYHQGKSEVVVGKALEDGYREKVKLATKLPTWKINSKTDMDNYFDEQITRLKTSYVDIYLLHGLNSKLWNKMLGLKVIEWAEKAIEDNKVKYLGFSFHDQFDVFRTIIDSYDWTVCQIQYNYRDVNHQAGNKGLKYAASKGLAVVVMEPIAGGTLAINPPIEIQAIWNQSKIERSPAEWALQWVWNHPEVSVVLSGMSSMVQVVENVKSASRSGSGTMTEKELDLVDLVRENYKQYGFIGCTSCRYCMPCPEGVSIPEILAFHNKLYINRKEKDARAAIIQEYKERISSENSARNCVNCGRCEEQCPQHLPVQALISRARRIFERNG